MPHYLIQASYTAEAVAKMTHKPEDREPVLRGLIERAGGKLKAFYFAFGENDVVAIFEAPDGASAAGISMAAASAGHLRSLQTTPLLTNQEGMEAMKKAGGMKYQAPAG